MAFQQLMEDGRNIRDVDDVKHTEVARMAAVTVKAISRIRGEIVSSLLGDLTLSQPPTIPPKSKEKSSSFMQPIA